ncbi:MAG: DEAD/DEAH box helicase [Brevundimonas sp.]|nr:DEAD/DEAH box helicase [Brevundimonas sp.]
MSDHSHFSPSPLVIDQLLRTRVTDAVIAQAAIRHPGLNAFLRERLAGRDVDRGALFSEPVIEAAASYRTSGRTPAELSGGLVHPKVVDALTAGSPGDDYRFVHPAYAHQVEAWKLLSPEKRNSVLVSSGTGSGKTECFLIPLLNDLAEESEREGRLSGVRALMLYPLNALIASQEQRLRRWTKPFGGKIRFGLYNGLMKDARKHERDRAEDTTPEQVLYRKTLRSDPPPILVTNNTMLEYMTIRKQDQPILERSRGKLRWIIIDEAHSYVGSAAAEVSLLLRRVLQAFEVEPENVRFVATSATIGGSDETAKADLRRYLADLSGAPIEHVHVVFGDREEVALPAPSPRAGPLEASRQSLESHPAVQSLVRAAEEGPLPLSKAAVHAEACNAEPMELLERIAGRGKEGGQALLPLRIHKFVRAIPGLSSCLNPACGGPKPRDWPFGSVLFDQTETCPHCQSPAFELINCRECGIPWLDAYDQGDKLTPRPSSPEHDEFAATSAMTEGGAFEVDEPDNEEPTPEPTPRLGARRLISLGEFPGGRSRTICSKSGALPERKSAGTDVWLSGLIGDGACPACGVAPTATTRSPLWPFRFGAPFLLQNATPTLLEGVSSHTSERQQLPGEGRQLLSFTDSRQGTARFAANIETQSERGYIRAFIYHLVQKGLAKGADTEERRTLDEEIAALSQHASNPTIAAMIEQKRVGRAALDQPSTVAWTDAVTALSEDPTVDQWIRAVWNEDRDQRFGDSTIALAEFLLLRELARRPRKANAVETMGLAQLRFPRLEALSEASLPAEFRAKGLTVTNWREYLYLLIDVVLRNVFVLRMSEHDARWLLPRHAFLRHIVGPGQTPNRIHDKVWPTAKAIGSKSYAVRALERGLQLDASEPEHRAIINAILQRAWDAISPLLEGPASTYALDLRKAELAPIREGWLCPVTNRVLSRLVFGSTPYSMAAAGNIPKPEPIRLPALPLVFPRNAQDRASIERALEADSAVVNLRERGVWSDLHSRAAMLTPYYRAEEHSAQQPPHRLRGFEAEFRDYKINLLACSTTMEMGVDIGSVEAVLNTNVPPSIANYRQRVGRAGRRGQGFSSSLTFARDTPLDREAFRQPSDYLRRTLRAPRVKLDSEPIVQRHVNARLLAEWFKAAEGQLIRARSGDFFGCPGDLKAVRVAEAPVERFITWLTDPSTAQAMSRPLEKLVGGTILSGRLDLLVATAAAFRETEQNFVGGWEALREQAQDIDPAAIGAIEKPLRRMCGEPLLGELANRSVLPGHGFPNAVVPFINECAESRDRVRDGDPEESNDRRYNYPSRNADVAIREYAPGAEVVIDGLVWTSAGVTLNWRRPAHEPGAKDIQSLKHFWVCEDCQEPGSGHVRATSCAACGSVRLNLGRFLAPAGFKVGWRDKPHAHTDTAQYIEPEPVRISAGAAAWMPLMDAAMGRYRGSHRGRLLHLSHGPGGAGYRVCLECGRSAVAGEPGFDDHEALTPVKGSSGGRCAGNDRPFARTEPLALGHETQTDVAELQPAALTSAGAAWALGSALRESLARELGIETRELGLSAEPRVGPVGEQTHSIFLWDVAAGGAGYAPQLFSDIVGVFSAAAQRLACPLECERGCSACILAADLYAQQTIVDRKAALEFVRSLLSAIGAPEKADRVDPACQLSAPTADAIVRRLHGGDIVALFISGEFDATTLSNPPFSTVFAAAQRLGAKCHLVLPPATFSQMDEAARRGLRNASHRQGFLPATGEPQTAPNGATLIAFHQRSDARRGYFSRDAAATVAGDYWGVGVSHPVVATSVVDPRWADIPEEELEGAGGGGASVRELKEMAPRPVRLFGTGLVSNIIRPELERAGLWLPGRLASMEYSDRYLAAPFPVLLMARTLAALHDQLAPKGSPTPLLIQTAPLSEPRYPSRPTRIFQNWPDEQGRSGTVERLLNSLGFDCCYQGSGAAHYRRLALTYEDGTTAVIFFDQGFGYWRASGSVGHDFHRSTADQVRSLLDCSAMAAGSGETYMAFAKRQS